MDYHKKSMFARHVAKDSEISCSAFYHNRVAIERREHLYRNKKRIERAVWLSVTVVWLTKVKEVIQRISKARKVNVTVISLWNDLTS